MKSECHIKKLTESLESSGSCRLLKHESHLRENQDTNPKRSKRNHSKQDYWVHFLRRFLLFYANQVKHVTTQYLLPVSSPAVPGLLCAPAPSPVWMSVPATRIHCLQVMVPVTCTLSIGNGANSCNTYTLSTGNGASYMYIVYR